MKSLLGLLLVASLVANPFLVQTIGDDGYGGYRLPTNQIPSRYQIDLEVKSDVFEGTSLVFNGTVVVEFTVTEATDTIMLHAPVEVDAVALISNEGTVNVSDFSDYNSTTSILTINVEEALGTTLNYTLTIEYTGELRPILMNGFYRSEYYDADGVLQYLVTSKFEPTWARYAFPCFDEPQLKATFVLSLIYPSNLNLNSMASTPQQNVQSLEDDYQRVTFVESPVMSTYLLAFIISEFTCTAGANIDEGVPYQVCSRAESAADRELAVDLGPPLMKSLETITNISYSSQNLGKMDQLAIPDFASGAMENWGLISYRETALLWGNEQSSTYYKKRVITVVAHEFTHSWFGNLVTMEWWDYIFLNEGFARFYQYFASAEVDELKDWELEKQFVVDQVQTVLVSDGSSSAAALTSKASTPTQISNKFSTISYSKGASILRMMEHFIGPENFKSGIRDYLNTYSWGNTVPSQLVASLANFTAEESLPSGVDLATVMENWLDLGGFPLVTVTSSGNDVILSQARFVYSGSSEREWYVPITYTLSNDTSTFEKTASSLWLVPGENTTLSGVLQDNDWIIVNNQESGYYRVNYDSALWEKIKEVLQTNHTAIDVLNRAQIVDDAANLARAGILKYSEVFKIIRYLANETEYYPWYSAITALNYLLRMVGDSSVLGDEIASLLSSLELKVYDTVSFTDLDADQHIYSMKVALILTSACKLGHEDCVSNAKSLFSQYKEGASIDRDLRSIVYCYGLRYSEDSTADWEYLWEQYHNTDLSTEHLTIIEALGCTRNITLLKYYLDQSVNISSGIRYQDLSSVWSAVYGSGVEGVDAAFEYIAENYEKLYAYYSSAASMLSTVVGRFTTEEQLAKLEEFIALEELPDSVRSTAQSAQTSAQNNFAWVANIESDLLEYFEVSETEPTTESTETEPTTESIVTEPTTESDQTTVAVDITTPDGATQGGASLGLIIFAAIMYRMFL